MGGDHKCPVCQATFTRPQHVARHMRSHTGDRPYKCQFCGDQFARSDLLSRHVNKCHANEKPQASTGARRKGAASATRATTSKQACDQCVQSSLPCDGCNPCSKCISRKCRCTFVKFHRQTAPAGPGHNVRANAPSAALLAGGLPPVSSLSSAAASSSRLPLYQQSEDDFILGPAPSAIPTMAEAFYNSNTFAFPPLYPAHNDPNGLSDTATADYSSKYRAQQAELFGPGRSGLGTGLTPLYDPRPGSSTSSSSWLGGWEAQDPNDAYHPQSQRHADLVSASAPPTSHIHDKQLQAELAQHSNNHFIHGANPSNSNPGGNPPVSVAMPYPAGHSSNSFTTGNSLSRRASVDFNGSDGSVGGSGSNSASSSNVHLPSGMGAYGNNGYLVGGDLPNRHTSTSSNSSQQRGYDRYAPQDDRHEFSSAFGLMSLDDPAVMAGLAADGQPFFSNTSAPLNQDSEEDGLLTTDVGADMGTPMPLKRDAGQLHLPSISQRPATSHGAPSGGFNGSGMTLGLPTPSKEMDARELKEFWKQYMRTPFTGPQDPSLAAGGANFGSAKGGVLTPFRRPRVSSLPSAKTPMVEKDEMYSQMQYGQGQQGQRHRENPQLGPTSSMRTTLHGKEDLRSYEAAVMARKAPTTLNLQVRRPMKGKPGQPAQQGHHHPSRSESRSESEEHSASSSPHLGFNSRPSSSAGPDQNRPPSSSIGGAFTGHGSGPNITPASSARSSFSSSKDDSPSPSLSFSRDTSVDSDANSSDPDSGRPSFKRLPSQTLGPEMSKRVFLGYDDDVEDRERAAGWTTGAAKAKEMHLGGLGGGGGGGIGGMSHPDRVVASIAERRRRRMSAPSGRVGDVDVGDGQGSQKPKQGASDVPALGYAPGGSGGA